MGISVIDEVNLFIAQYILIYGSWRVMYAI